MASSGWTKNKRGVLVNSAGKTALQVGLEKRDAKLKERKEQNAVKLQAVKEKYAAKKAEAKAKASGSGEASDPSRDLLVAEIGRLTKNVQAKVRQQKEALQEIEGTLKDAETKGRAKKVREEIQELGSLLNEVDKTIKQVDFPKPASKGSEAIDPSRYLESNTSKTINTAYRVNKFDIDTVSSRKKAGDFDVEGDARKIASASGVTTNLPLVAMRQDKKIEVVAGDREFYANKRAQEINPDQEMVSGVFLKSSQIKGALSQKSVFKDHEGDFTVKSGQFSRVDTADIESSIKQPSKKVLDAQVKALLDTGDVGNVIPVILQRVGKKSAVNQKYKVVSGHDSFLAMRELQRRNPNYEMTNGFILD